MNVSYSDDKSANIEAQIQAVELDEALIDEEEEDIERLVADIADVNMITKRVATLVHEQGEQLGTQASPARNTDSGA